MSPAVKLLASRYRKRRIGRSSAAVRDLIVPFNDLLKEAGCLNGPLRSEAERDFQDLELAGLLELERASRDPSAILRVRLTTTSEEAFFKHVGETGPNSARRQLAKIFEDASHAIVPPTYQVPWENFCAECATIATLGDSLAPYFDRARVDQVVQILESLPELLSWQGESFRRFASAAVFGNSKTLEVLQPRIELCLQRIAGANGCRTLTDFGIRENPRGIILHGPLIFEREGIALDIRNLYAPIRLGAVDLKSSIVLTNATRCLTVENASMLHELAKLRSGVILASSGSEGGFAHSAIVDFLQSLPPSVELFHFGDSDPTGFDILRNLRERVRREIASLHMYYRPRSPSIPLRPDDSRIIRRLLESFSLNEVEKAQVSLIRRSDDKGAFEQESLGVPRKEWPFYSLARADNAKTP